MSTKLSRRSLADITSSMIQRLTMLISCSKYNSKPDHDQSAALEISDAKIAEMPIRDHSAALEISDAKIVEINKLMNPELCATMACDIYKNLRASEMKKRPLTDYIEKTQNDIDVKTRALLVDWLVEVADTYMLDSETLYLTVNYLDRYLSGNAMDIKSLKLLGVTCMMIATKYDDSGSPSPSAEKFLDLATHTDDGDEILDMERIVLNFLEFELTVPTVQCFLRLFVCADQAVTEDLSIDQEFIENSSIELECMSSYLAELSLVDYGMLCYAPSMIAASSIFLARFLLLPSRKPWNSTLQNYTLYKPSDMFKCVKALHCLCCQSPRSSLQAIRVKYSQPKFMCVSKLYCPPSISIKYFQNL